MLAPKRSSCSRVLGYAASLLAVLNARRIGSLIRLMSRPMRGPRKIKPANARSTHRMRMPR